MIGGTGGQRIRYGGAGSRNCGLAGREGLQTMSGEDAGKMKRSGRETAESREGQEGARDEEGGRGSGFTWGLRLRGIAVPALSGVPLAGLRSPPRASARRMPDLLDGDPSTLREHGSTQQEVGCAIGISQRTVGRGDSSRATVGCRVDSWGWEGKGSWRPRLGGKGDTRGSGGGVE